MLRNSQAKRADDAMQQKGEGEGKEEAEPEAAAAAETTEVATEARTAQRLWHLVDCNGFIFVCSVSLPLPLPLSLFLFFRLVVFAAV